MSGEKLENLNLDRQFFELWKRVIAPGYVGADGMPGLTSKDVKRPEKKKIVVSNGARWTRLVTSRACYLWTPDFRDLNYIPGHHPGDLSADPAKPWLSCSNGSLKLYAPGEWHFNTPVGEDDTEGDFVPLLVADAPTGLTALGMDAGDVTGTTKIKGGILPVTMQAPGVNADIDVASETLLAKDSKRRYVFIQNTSTGGQTLWLAFGTAAILGRGIPLYPGEWWESTLPGAIRQSIQVISDAVNGSASYQAGR